MGQTAVWGLALACGVAALGCSRDDVAALLPGADASMDAGDGFAFDFKLYALDPSAEQTKGPPIPGAMVVLDLPSGERQELVTDADGNVRLEVPAEVDHFTWTVAKLGYLPVRSFYRVTAAEVHEQMSLVGELFTTMAPTPAPSPDDVPMVALTFDSGGVDFCGSGDWHDSCIGPSDRPSHAWDVPQESQPYLFVAYSIDERLCPIELREVTFPDTLTDQEAVLVFDGSNPAEPETFDMTLRLPTSPSSLLRDVYLRERHPLFITNPTNRIYGGACDKQFDPAAGTVRFTASYFPREGVPLTFEIAIFPADVWTWGEDAPLADRRFSARPEAGVYDVLDIPVLSSPAVAPSRSSIFSWQPIDNASTFYVELKKRGFRDHTLWTTTSWREQDLALPALPAGYDELAEWDGPDNGLYRVTACADWLPQVFANPAWASVHELPLEWNCASSEALPGAIVE